MQYSSRSENYSSSLRDSPPKWTGGKVSEFELFSIFIKISSFRSFSFGVFQDHKAGYSYKTSAAYQYSTAGAGSGSYQDKPVDKNIDQLDALLEDLKNEREITRDRGMYVNV